jgi:hypothetical protein
VTHPFSFLSYDKLFNKSSIPKALDKNKIPPPTPGCRSDLQPIRAIARTNSLGTSATQTSQTFSTEEYIQINPPLSFNKKN